MIRDFKVSELYECHFDGALVVDTIEMLQRVVEQYGTDSTITINYDYDDCLLFSIFALREETSYEEEVRVKLEAYEQQNTELYERKEYQRLKDKYGDKEA